MNNESNNRLECKLDKVQESIANIDKTLAVNTESLVTHIKRTNLLEKKLECELKPLTIHVERVNGILKFLLFAAALSGIVKLFF